MSLPKMLVAMLVTCSQVCQSDRFHESDVIIRHVLMEVYGLEVCHYRIGAQSGVLTDSSLWAAKFTPYLADDEGMWSFYETMVFGTEPFCFDEPYSKCEFKSNEVDIHIRYSVPVEIEGDVFLYLEWNFNWEEGEGAVIKLSGTDYTIKGVYEIWRS